MSLGVVVKGTEGIVLAADSRVTLSVKKTDGTEFPINFDNATKLLTFSGHRRWIAAVTYGDAVIGGKPNNLRTAHSFVHEFEASVPAKSRPTVEEFAIQFSEFFLNQWTNTMPSTYSGSGMTFVIGGFDKDSPYGSVYEINIPNEPTPVEKSPDTFGITWGGQPEYVARLIHGYDRTLLDIAKQTLNLSSDQVTKLRIACGVLNMGVPYAILSLQDCINLAIFLVKTTIEAQSLSIGLRGVGGAIDVVAIQSRDGIHIIQQKKLVGEKSTQKYGGFQNG